MDSKLTRLIDRWLGTRGPDGRAERVAVESVRPRVSIARPPASSLTVPLLAAGVLVLVLGFAWYNLLPRLGLAGSAPTADDWPKPIATTTCTEWAKEMSSAQRNSVGTGMLLSRRSQRDAISAAPSADQVRLYISALSEWCARPPEDVVAKFGEAVAFNLTTAADAMYDAYRDALTGATDEPGSAPIPESS